MESPRTRKPPEGGSAKGARKAPAGSVQVKPVAETPAGAGVTVSQLTRALEDTARAEARAAQAERFEQAMAPIRADIEPLSGQERERFMHTPLWDLFAVIAPFFAAPPNGHGELLRHRPRAPEVPRAPANLAAVAPARPALAATLQVATNPHYLT